jgi:Ca2+-transporting ATPase
MTNSKHLNLFHSQPTEKVLKELSSEINGLSHEEAKLRLEKFGLNEIPEKRGRHPALIFLKQFKGILIYILIVAAVISFFIGHLIDVYVIITVILINATMGFVQEYKAEKAIKALKKMIVSYAKVFREGELLQISAKGLVPGDIIFLEEGDRISADARLIEVKNFRTVEASLTGESLPIDKDIKALSEKTGLADCKNMVWMGTFVASGQAKAVVTSTGIETAIGKIAQSIERIKKVKGHFEKKTDTLAKQMGIIAAMGASVVFLVGFFVKDFEFFEIFLFTIASLVSGIPEGLPAILVIVLAIGAHRMAKRNAIIKTLPATETLGVATTIATDKTGTLTQNTMNVEKIILPDGDEITVSGEGWKPAGDFFQKDEIIFPLENPRLAKLLHIANICNYARLVKEEDEEDGYKILGDPTEAALVVLAEKAGLKKEVLLEKEKRIDDLPFNPASFMLEKRGEKKITSEERQEILAKTQGLARKAMRVLALAYKKVPLNVDNLTEDLVNELVFVGIVGMLDPPRPEVKEAIAKAKKAGISVIMKTGDHKDTAVAIAKEIGLIDEKNEKEKSKYPEVLTEQELLKLSEEEFEEAVKHVSVFARLTPDMNMKLKIVEALQEQGHIVAMTGDGVNDAPALKRADIGVAMGIIGTDVARESSAMVLADDNFASIVNAIEEGRTVFTNTRQASSFLVTTNFAEDLSIITALLLGFPLPLLPTHILWLNLVTDGVSDVALAAEPSHEDVLEELPRKKEENILSREIVPFILIMASIMTILTVTVFNAYLPSGIEKARTGVFAIMAFTQLFNVLNMRSLKKSVFKIGFFSNKFIIASLTASVVLLVIILYVPFFQRVFQFAPLGLLKLLIIILLSSLVLWTGELYKHLKNKYFA